jgi:hypothetical protein
MCIVLLCSFTPLVVLAGIIHITGIGTFHGVLYSGPAFLYMVLGTMGFAMAALHLIPDSETVAR